MFNYFLAFCLNQANFLIFNKHISACCCKSVQGVQLNICPLVPAAWEGIGKKLMLLQSFCPTKTHYPVNILINRVMCLCWTKTLKQHKFGWILTAFCYLTTDSSVLPHTGPPPALPTVMSNIPYEPVSVPNGLVSTEVSTTVVPVIPSANVVPQPSPLPLPVSTSPGKLSSR